jgi:hypothetical protein
MLLIPALLLLLLLLVPMVVALLHMLLHWPWSPTGTTAHRAGLHASSIAATYASRTAKPHVHGCFLLFAAASCCCVWPAPGIGG